MKEKEEEKKKDVLLGALGLTTGVAIGLARAKPEITLPPPEVHVDIDEEMLARAIAEAFAGIPVVTEPILWEEGETYTITIDTSPKCLKDVDVPCKGVTIKNDDHNTGIIYWGFKPDVSSETGYPLEPSQSFTIPIDNLNKIWVVASESGQKLRIAYGR
jgi:hypothetical protein